MSKYIEFYKICASTKRKSHSIGNLSECGIYQKHAILQRLPDIPEVIFGRSTRHRGGHSVYFLKTRGQFFGDCATVRGGGGARVLRSAAAVRHGRRDVQRRGQHGTVTSISRMVQNRPWGIEFKL